MYTPESRASLQFGIVKQGASAALRGGNRCVLLSWVRYAKMSDGGRESLNYATVPNSALRPKSSPRQNKVGDGAGAKISHKMENAMNPTMRVVVLASGEQCRRKAMSRAAAPASRPNQHDSNERRKVICRTAGVIREAKWAERVQLLEI